MSYEEWGLQFDNKLQAIDYIIKSIPNMNIQDASVMVSKIWEGVK